MAYYKTASPTGLQEVLSALTIGGTKVVLNNTANPLIAGSVVAWQADGSVALASASSLVGGADFAGVVRASIPAYQYGYIYQQGMVPGVVTSLGAIPGQAVYLSETPGQMTLIASTNPDDTIFKLGIAEPANGSLSGAATDLRLTAELIASPGAPVPPPPPSGELAVSAGEVVKNNTGSTLAAYSAVAWRTDGSVELASASGNANLAGFVQTAILTGQSGYIYQEGVVPGILTSSGAAPGLEVYLSETPGQITLIAPTSPTDAIIRVGTAIPPSGSLTGEATDLRIEVEIISEP